MIADPYLAGLQLGQFLYAVNPESTEVTLLTSTLAFKSKTQEPSKIDDFWQRMTQLKADAKLTAKTYVLQPAVLHDRFLVIDDAVWFLGNSLNTLGDKASVIVKLPNPDEVIGQLEDMLRQAMSFDDYRQRQTRHQEDRAS